MYRLLSLLCKPAPAQPTRHIRKMSQKTHPYSCRLQTTNKRFECSWYSDYFYSDMSSNDLEIRSYIERVIRSISSTADQVEHSHEYLSLQNHYKRCLISLFVVDTRQMLFDGLLGPRTRMKSGLTAPSNHAQALPRTTQTTPSASSSVRLTRSIEMKEAYNHSHTSVSALSTRYASERANARCVRGEGPPRKHGKGVVEHEMQLMLFARSKHRRSHFANLISLLGESMKLQGLVNLSTHIKLVNDINDRLTSSTENHLDLISSQSSFSKASQFGWLPYGLTSSTNPQPVDMAKNSGLWHDKKGKAFTQFDVFHYLHMQHDSYLSCFISISSVQVLQDFISVNHVINEIISLLKRRSHFRQITECVFREAQKQDFIKAIRLSCSGRVGGGSKKAQKSRTQSFQWGESGLHSFSSHISFANSSAATPFGRIGVQLWLSWNMTK